MNIDRAAVNGRVSACVHGDPRRKNLPCRLLAEVVDVKLVLKDVSV